MSDLQHVCRRIASSFLNEMGHQQVTFEQLDKRGQWRPGAAQSAIIGLARGRDIRISTLVLLAGALHLKIHFDLARRNPADIDSELPDASDGAEPEGADV